MSNDGTQNPCLQILILSPLVSPPCIFGTLQNSENPTLNLSFFALMRFNLRAEKPFEAAIAVRPLHPFGDSERVLLVGRSSRTRKSSVPKCRVVQPPLSDWAERSSRRTDGLSDVAHSRNASVCRLGYRPLHVEMEHGFGCPCPQFGQPPPARIA